MMYVRGIAGCLCSLAIASSALAVDPHWTDSEWGRFLSAIRQVEGAGDGIKGDNGDALGTYQIHKAYFEDSRVPGKWEDCLNDTQLSERVVRAYIKRYLPAGGSPGDAARIHNGGPTGHKKSATLRYLAKFLSFFK